MNRERERCCNFQEADLERTTAPMDETVLERARAGDGHAFQELVEPLRREILMHCYRILGSLHDAEDILQETLLSAWRALDRFDGRALRAWVYRPDPNSPIWRARGLIVLSLRNDQVSCITRFDPAFLDRFGLPRTLPRD